MHKSAYGDDANRALALLLVDIEAPSARGKRKCIRIRIRIFADFGRKCPPMKLIRLCPSPSPLDARGVFCPCTPFFGPSDGLSSFWAIVVGIRLKPCHRGRQGFDFQTTMADGIKKRHGNVIVFSVIPSPALHGPMGYGQSSAPYRRPESPLKMKSGSGQSKPVFTLLSHYADIMHFVCSRMHQLCTFCPKARSQ